MELLIYKWPFTHLMHETAQVQGSYDLWFQVCTGKALQEAAEYHLTYLFDYVNLCAIQT